MHRLALSVIKLGSRQSRSQLTRLYHPLRQGTGCEENWETRPLTVAILLGLIVIFTVRYTRSPWRKVPPSPRRLPIIGNALHLVDKSWLFSRDCKERFGEIMYLDAAGQPTVVLNSLKSAFNLLDRRASNYSDRPRFIMAQEILNNGLVFVFLNYGDRWRRMRRAAHEALTKRTLQSYRPIQAKEATILVSSLLASSGSLRPDKHFQRFAASTIMSIVYDYPTIVSDHDQAIERIEQYTVRVSNAATPGSNLVDILPWMIHIPERFAKWKRDGQRQFNEYYAMFRGLLNRVRADLANGVNRPSFCASLIENAERDRLSEPEMTFLAGLLYSAGAETTATTLSWWALAMIAFPEAQRRAQAELDAVVGRDRLPTIADAPRLPYLGAVIREVLRWRPALPLGVPHAATNDDWYEGMFIPKGTICIPNAWNCNHDRDVFGPDADEFRVERHLDERGELLSGPLETSQAGHVTFGFGRRICVGKDLALESLFITTARILWAANLERGRDEDGMEVQLDTDTLVDVGLVVLVRVICIGCQDVRDNDQVGWMARSKSGAMQIEALSAPDKLNKDSLNKWICHQMKFITMLDAQLPQLHQRRRRVRIALPTNLGAFLLLSLFDRRLSPRAQYDVPSHLGSSGSEPREYRAQKGDYRAIRDEEENTVMEARQRQQ
ncbi:cytochrome P450 [Russula dissimulans]|nr:cytochrome P450 [Russula dissimulans]